MYLIRLVSNPHVWGSGDLWIERETWEATQYELGQIANRTDFPDLNDRRLYEQGYPGYAFLDMKVYEAKEIEL